MNTPSQVWVAVDAEPSPEFKAKVVAFFADLGYDTDPSEPDWLSDDGGSTWQASFLSIR